MSFDKIFDLTSGVYFYYIIRQPDISNIIRNKNGTTANAEMLSYRFLLKKIHGAGGAFIPRPQDPTDVCMNDLSYPGW